MRVLSTICVIDSNSSQLINKKLSMILGSSQAKAVLLFLSSLSKSVLFYFPLFGFGNHVPTIYTVSVPTKEFV